MTRHQVSCRSATPKSKLSSFLFFPIIFLIFLSSSFLILTFLPFSYFSYHLTSSSLLSSSSLSLHLSYCPSSFLFPSPIVSPHFSFQFSLLTTKNHFYECMSLLTWVSCRFRISKDVAPGNKLHFLLFFSILVSCSLHRSHVVPSSFSSLSSLLSFSLSNFPSKGFSWYFGLLSSM